MTKVFKAAGLWLAISVVVWLITVWRWQSTGHDPSTGDIVGQLFVLPVLLALAFWAAWWGIKRLREQAARPVVPSAAPAAAATAAVAAPISADEALRQASAWVLAEAVNLRVGSDAASALVDLRGQMPRPSLDAQLQDHDGMPVFTARVPDLEVDEWLQAHAALGPEGEQALPEAVLRSLALLDAPLHQMLDMVAELVPAQADGGASAGLSRPASALQPGGQGGDQGPAHLAGVATQVPKAVSLSREARAPQLTVRLVLPTHWAQADREAAINWVRSQCGSLLDWAQVVQAKGILWVTDAVAQPEALWDEVDQHMLQWARQSRPELLLILAVDSAITESHIERMQAVGELFTSAHQTGKVPGEGAAALLIANTHWPDITALELPPVRIWRPVRARRDKSADAAGRVGATALSALLGHALGLNKASQDTLLVLADADHRASRSSELFEALQEAMPGVDPMLAVTRVGEACGELGVARALVPSALACAALRSGESPQQVAVATHVQSSHDRVVVALAPWAPEPAAA
jgi:hypothetical protein